MLATAAVAAETNSPPTFQISSFEVEGNTVLPREKIDAILTNYAGHVTVDRLTEGLGALQLLYRNLGFATISVTLPQQRLTNGVVRVRVVEGRLARIDVVGNRYYSSNNVMRALPGIATNTLLNNRWFQPELDRANNNMDRSIYPSVSPGAQPGESDLTLKVKDRLPLHAHVELNNKATPGTPGLRMDTAVQYNNLWQEDHQIGIEYNFSPQDLKTFDTGSRFYDQPAVASYSGFYRIPLGPGENYRETTERLPVDFGYDQITHQFRLPPPTGGAELILYGSRSTSEIPPYFGAVTPIASNQLSTITQQTEERDTTYSENLGMKFTLPMKTFASIRSSLTFGIDFKTYSPSFYLTNYSYFSLYSLDQFGNPALVTNQTIALAADTHYRLDYFPLSLGWSAERPDSFGDTTFTINESIFLSGLSSSREAFETVAGAAQAGGNYGVTTAGLTREQRLGRDWSLLLRSDGQWAAKPLINNEQFALGGSGGVRGYEEGETYGDAGWRLMADVRAPAIAVGEFPYFGRSIPANIRASVFMDYGENMLIDRPGDIRLWGTGVGFYYTAGQRVDARLTLAWALNNGPLRSVGNTSAYFTIGLQL